MHIKPIPLGLIILGAGILIGSPQDTIRWFLRNPVWVMQNWRSQMRGLMWGMIIGAVILAAGIIGWFI